MPLSRWLFPVLMLLLAGCADRAAPPPVSAPESASVPRVANTLPADAQNCLNHTECTLKTSRSLLFVFDYAAAGGALVESDGRLLSTPPKAPRNGWPALRIQLADPEGGHFDFHSECRQKRCRISNEKLLTCYRAYLDGQACPLR
ncbi:hypothetical protein [Pseudomonas panipatensis]|uniref:Lipoprotein n=1 Tax=Pseudomonas panipatensis TaxID=428992 RepID=A0A1G8K7R5_9PSED|nr:hypothetical protein [Pseudomonas panipatensis]SDI39498.1 hypothetical protein SAMN05216272_108307 [Pseudomonas panipatensis]SMP60550.1 hypothetical protein SAMN06295951_10531 [Pseudomonas panipatensis]